MSNESYRLREGQYCCILGQKKRLHFTGTDEVCHCHIFSSLLDTKHRCRIALWLRYLNILEETMDMGRGMIGR